MKTEKMTAAEIDAHMLAALHSAANAIERIDAGLETDTKATLATVRAAIARAKGRPA